MPFSLWKWSRIGSFAFKCLQVHGVRTSKRQKTTVMVIYGIRTEVKLKIKNDTFRNDASNLCVRFVYRFGLLHTQKKEMLTIAQERNGHISFDRRLSCICYLTLVYGHEQKFLCVCQQRWTRLPANKEKYKSNVPIPWYSHRNSFIWLKAIIQFVASKTADGLVMWMASIAGLLSIEMDSRACSM